MNVSSLEGHSYVVVCGLLSSFICDFLLSNPVPGRPGFTVVVMSVWSLNFSGRISGVFDSYLALGVTAAKGIQQNLHNLELVDLNRKLLLYI